MEEIQEESRPTRNSNIDERSSIVISSTNTNEISREMTLSESDLELIRRLVDVQIRSESQSEEEIRRITPFSLGDCEEDRVKRFQHITEFADLTLVSITNFAKGVPLFSVLPIDDQIRMMQGSLSEIMMLWAARKYDSETDSIKFSNDRPYTRGDFYNSYIGNYTDLIFTFCQKMSGLKLNYIEYILLSIPCIFSDRPDLQEKKKVQENREHYSRLLKAYIACNRPTQENYFVQLLSILEELHILGKMTFIFCSSLKSEGMRFPVLVEETWT